MPTVAQWFTEISVMNKASDIQTVVGIRETANPANRGHLQLSYPVAMRWGQITNSSKKENLKHRCSCEMC